MKNNSIKLSDIYRDMRQMRRKLIKETKSNAMRFSRPMTEVIITSGAFTQNEVAALQGFFEFRGRTPLLNENSIKVVDKEINSKFVQEGIVSWLKGKGTAVLDALKSGWAGLKKIWGNFKEFVASCVQSIKNAFKKMTDSVMKYINGKLAWITESGTKLKAAVGSVQEADAKAGGIEGFVTGIDDKVNAALGMNAAKFHSTLNKDIVNLGSCTKHIAVKVGDIVSGKSWEKQVVSGDDAGAKDVDVTVAESIRKEYESLFGNKELMMELRNFNLKEAGIQHPEDVVKDVMSVGGEKGKKLGKALSAVVKVVLGILKYTVGIFSTIINKIGAIAGKNVCKAVSWVSSLFKGPGTFDMIAIGFFCGELFEVFAHKQQKIHKLIEAGIDLLFGVAKAAMPWAYPALETLQIIVSITGYIFFYYAIGTLIANTIIPAIKLWLQWVAKEFKDAISEPTAKPTAAPGGA